MLQSSTINTFGKKLYSFIYKYSLTKVYNGIESKKNVMIMKNALENRNFTLEVTENRINPTMIGTKF